MPVRSTWDYNCIANRLNNKTRSNLVFIGVKIWQKPPQKKPQSRPLLKNQPNANQLLQKAEELAQAEKELAVAQAEKAKPRVLNIQT